LTADRMSNPPRLDDDRYLEPPIDISERAVPVPSPETEKFWQGLKTERLVLDRCVACERYSHYPTGGCSWCGAPGTVPTTVDGAGSVYSFTMAELAFGPGITPPYVVVAVEPDCQPGLKLLGNLVNCRIRDVVVGLRVQPRFVHGTDASLLFFEPAPSAG
jgi:uncharacterized OB-fold protein